MIQSGFALPEYLTQFMYLARAESQRREYKAERTAAKKERSQKPPKPGYVYLLRSSEGHYKIGRTVDPKNRMKTFGVQLPFDVAYEHVFACENMSAKEKELHTRFADKRVNGEWFNLSPEDVEYVKSLDGAS